MLAVGVAHWLEIAVGKGQAGGLQGKKISRDRMSCGAEGIGKEDFTILSDATVDGK